MEKGVAVEQFEHYNSVRDVALAAGFALDCEEDVTAYVLPFMLRYERLAGRFFTHPILARLVGAVLPKAFIYNALSGFLFPDIIEAGLFKYMITVFKKQV